MADFIREFECATRASNSGYLLGGLLAGALISLAISNAWGLDRYLSGICGAICMGLGVIAGALILALVHDACAI
jgi:hypothetical protein